MRSVHLIGICGTGMGSFAGLLQAAGFDVRGSDQAAYPPMSEKLEAWGIEVRTPYAASNLEPRPDLVVVGNAIRREHPEAEAARAAGLETTSFPAALSEWFLAGRHPVVVAGTHGKTTTTSAIAHLLVEAGLDPGFLIGGVPQNFGEGFRAGGPEAPDRPFVVEGDEYDTAYFDKGPKFLHYRPRTLVLTSLEFDHADIYRSLDEIRDRFRQLVALVPPDGCIFAQAHADLPLEAARAPVVRYGIDAGDRRATDVELGAFGARFRFDPSGERRAFEWTQAGRFNVDNALAACLVAERFGVPQARIARALKTFAGVDRRQTLRAVVDGVRLIDDFAHHPTAVSVTLEGLRQRYPEGQLIAVFEPRTATSARNVFQTEYARAFDAADHVVVAGVGRPELPEAERLDVQRLAAELGERGTEAVAIPEIGGIVAHLVHRAAPGDTVAFMSNGGFGGVIPKTEAALRARPPAC
ncbi:MAG TPA: Mur ligase family protein [Myxococcales bacterium LLY-WYZ-16_1]|jgi:UDP-N-acetylmuramate: L-alanyl-gamma-D-glutamyl-meso-diaminopimelate ligase|nr:Mur ligase family protein [Myxococcales bacterium LLY-WYZ-16_1]